MPRPILRDLISPASTALVTQECQGGVLGAEAGLPMLAEEAAREAIPNIVELVAVARAVGVPVVHCLIQRRSDGRGSNSNARLFAAGTSFDADLTPGSPDHTLLIWCSPERTARAR